MKFFLLAGLLLSATAFAAETDFSSYCLKYLNGEMGQKPDIMQDFKAVEETLMIKGQKQKTIMLQATGESNYVSDVDTKFDKSSKTETQTIVMSTKNKKGKDVKDYTLIIERNENGDIIKIKKKYPLKDFHPGGDKIDFITQNGTCMPGSQHSGLKRDFNSGLCRDLKQFFAKNPDAESCLKSGYEKQMREIVAKYQYAYKPFMNENLGNSLLLRSGSEISKCYEAGLTPMIDNDKVWAVDASAPVNPENGSSGETEED